eukprot:CAMPEP_0170517934 /NCGR_PEP_ID=MMETSP0209-20121228/3745_1 /TAXON_ID=665100 ORGANISM="Litonotus pictus, Strain P1" /NCGR_SAMPLE_ID=MMETSP0209 /ASSEMBLY_ACC=CAM_ASM_000301 /LENGTH=294 /DNA_ID=CAMNT_0010803309 /DNA_START=368 /DNA_END=1252 /DNA_ORIENTATION=+
MPFHDQGEIEKRKNQIEDYLNLINNHEYLNKSPYFTRFLSQTFDTNEKAKIQNDRSYFQAMTSYFGISNSTTNKNPVFSNNVYDSNDKQNLERLYYGVCSTITTIEKLRKTVSSKNESLSKIKDFSKSIFETLTKRTLDVLPRKVSEDQSNERSMISTNTEGDRKLSGEIEDTHNTMEQNEKLLKIHLENSSSYGSELDKTLKKLTEYSSEIAELIDMFKRLDDFINSNREDYLSSIGGLKEYDDFKELFKKQAEFEIKGFRSTRESQLILILSEFHNLRQMLVNNINLDEQKS